MQTFNYLYENLIPSGEVLKYADKCDILYFDIETTGLSKVKNHIYLIGCGYYTDEGLNVIQWIAERESDEILILSEFENFSGSFSSLINYNGKAFDIPFITARMEKYGLNMPEFASTDIYALIKPLKRFLSLDDLTQKSIERFLGVPRKDIYSGRDLIFVYKDYTVSRSQSSLNKLLLHNMEDVLNMHYISEILKYLKLADCRVSYCGYDEKEYRDYNGTPKKELIIHSMLNTDSSDLNDFNSYYNSGFGSFIMNCSCCGDVSVRIPVYCGCLKYYIPNYRDYYYLPKEDMCIYKSIGSGVPKSDLENAKKETCYIKCTDTFIPVNDKASLPGHIKCFRDEYKSKYEYMRLTDFLNMSDDEKSAYAASVMRSFK